MIKGVSRKIVEVNNPNNVYFEKAVLYLKPRMSQLPESMLNKEAEYYVSEMTSHAENIDNKNKFPFSVLCISLSIFILLITTIILI